MEKLLGCQRRKNWNTKSTFAEEFVSDNLEHPLPFILHDAASSGQVLENESLESSLTDLGLIPTSILSFAWHPDVAEEVKQQLGPNAAYLKDSVMALAKSDWNKQVSMF